MGEPQISRLFNCVRMNIVLFDEVMISAQIQASREQEDKLSTSPQAACFTFVVSVSFQPKPCNNLTGPMIKASFCTLNTSQQ